MRLGEPFDPALQAASQALSGRAKQTSSRFASIELRTQESRLTQLAPVGYAATVIAALTTVAFFWTL